jgi:heme oxygenase
MATLKELTSEVHRRAENTPLMQALLRGELSDCQYSQYLYTHFQIYDTIEHRTEFVSPDLKLAMRAFEDWQGIPSRVFPPDCSELEDYLQYLREVSPQKLPAHIYVHYLATAYGGSIIKRVMEPRVPTSLYVFHDRETAISEVRALLTTDMADECIYAFEKTIAYYEQLWQQISEN